MSTVAIDQPQLQPGLFALLASLHKLARQQSMGTQVVLADAAAPCAKSAIDMLSNAGVPGMVDLCTWRAMVAPWVMLIGLYCCHVGRWRQQWLHDQQQVLQQPSSSVSCDGADAGAALQAFCTFSIALQKNLGRIKQVGSLWESGIDSTFAGRSQDSSKCTSSNTSINPAALEGGGLLAAECVAKWQQWQQSTAACGQQQQQRQQSAAATVAGVQACAVTSATVQPSVPVLTGQQQPPQQQQVQAPVDGSLKQECYTLVTTVVHELRDSRDVVRRTQEHLKHLECCSLHGTNGAQPCSSSSACSADPNSDGEHEQVQVVTAAKQKVKEATKFHSSIQACLEFARLVKQLQDTGEAICAKLPVPWMCSNPHCTCLAGVSELQLVGGKACVCGGCRVAR
jgi:hypothetical protein